MMTETDRAEFVSSTEVQITIMTSLSSHTLSPSTPHSLQVIYPLLKYGQIENFCMSLWLDISSWLKFFSKLDEISNTTNEFCGLHIGQCEDMLPKCHKSWSLIFE